MQLGTSWWLASARCRRRTLITGVAGGVGATAFDSTSGLAVDGVGRILVGGSTEDAAGHYRAYVTRLTSSGSIDTTFGTSGFTILPSPKNANTSGNGTDGYAMAVWRLTH